MNLAETQEYFNRNDRLWTLLGAIFKNIAESGGMDELYVVSKALDELICQAQKEIALRN